MEKAIITLLIIILAWSYMHEEKYSGANAQEWFGEYSEAQSRYQTFRYCVEDYDNMTIDEKLDWGGVFYYCE